MMSTTPNFGAESEPATTELLSAWATRRSEEAFRELVVRYSGLVYSTVMRSTGGRDDLAPDIVQQVFVDLARRPPSLVRERRLGLWLHQRARWAAADALKSERRRRRREAAYAAEQKYEYHEIEGIRWKDWAPELDRALEKLPAGARNAVLLRFLEGRQFSAVGEALGIGEDAARKRVSTALGKLRKVLAKRGIAVTSASLLAALCVESANAAATVASASWVKAVPLGAASAVGSSSLFAKSILIMTSEKKAIVTAVSVALVAAVPITLQQARINGFKEQVQALSIRPSVTPAGAASETDRGSGAHAGPLRKRGDAVSTERMIRDTRHALTRHTRTRRYVEFAMAIDGLDADNWRAMLDEFFAVTASSGRKNDAEWIVFTRRAGEVAGEEAVEYFKSRGVMAEINNSMQGWASMHPDDALAWVEAQEDPKFQEKVLRAMVQGMVQTDPERAVAAVEKLRDNRTRYMDGLVSSVVQARGIRTAMTLFRSASERAESVGERMDSPYLKRFFSDLTERMFFVNDVAGTPEAMAEWLDSFEGKPWVTQGMLTRAAHVIALQDPARSIDWIATLDGNPVLESLDRPVERLLDAWIKRDDVRAPREWLAGSTDHPLHDQIAVGYVQRLAATDPVAATSLVATIRDEELRDHAARRLAQSAGR